MLTVVSLQHRHVKPKRLEAYDNANRDLCEYPTWAEGRMRPAHAEHVYKKDEGEDDVKAA